MKLNIKTPHARRCQDGRNNLTMPTKIDPYKMRAFAMNSQNELMAAKIGYNEKY